MNLRKSIRFNQNFFKDADLVAAVVRQANFNPQDIVYEIGPGYGIITQALAKKVKKVVGIEIDKELFLRLKQKFANRPNIQLVNADICGYRLPHQAFKVFANIPFNLTAGIIKKLLAGSGLQEAYLVVQKEAAGKFCGLPKETQFSILHKPWFEFKIAHQFNRSDFTPEPAVDAVLLRICRRRQTLVADAHQKLYFWFVQLGFNRWRKNLGKNFKEVFTYNQWRRLTRDLKFPVKALPSGLTFFQWLGLFNFYQTIK